MYLFWFIFELTVSIETVTLCTNVMSVMFLSILKARYKILYDSVCKKVESI